MNYTLCTHTCTYRVSSCLYFSVFSVFFCISCLSVFFLYLGDFFIIFCISPNFTLIIFFSEILNGSQIFCVCNLKKFRLQRAMIPSLFLLKVDNPISISQLYLRSPCHPSGNTSFGGPERMSGGYKWVSPHDYDFLF